MVELRIAGLLLVLAALEKSLCEKGTDKGQVTREAANLELVASIQTISQITGVINISEGKWTK